MRKIKKRKKKKSSVYGCWQPSPKLCPSPEVCVLWTFVKCCRGWGDSTVQVKSHEAKNINGHASASENAFVIFVLSLVCCRCGFISVGKVRQRLLQMTHQVRRSSVSAAANVFNSGLMIKRLKLEKKTETDHEAFMSKNKQTAKQNCFFVVYFCNYFHDFTHRDSGRCSLSFASGTFAVFRTHAQLHSD